MYFAVLGVLACLSGLLLSQSFARAGTRVEATDHDATRKRKNDHVILVISKLLSRLLRRLHGLRYLIAGPSMIDEGYTKASPAIVKKSAQPMYAYI